MSSENTGNQLPPDSFHDEEMIEISLSQILSFIKKYWGTLCIVGLVAGGLGIGVSFLIPKEFTSSAKILPEYSADIKGGNLGALASLAGVSLGDNSDAIRPDLYPDILQSRPFLLQLLTTPLPTEADTLALLTILLGDDEIQPFTKAQIARADSVLTLTEEQEDVFEDISKRISASNDKLTGILTIEIELPDPVMAAAVTNLAVNYLKTFVADYRTTKESDKVRFLQKQLAESKGRYQRSEYALNAYRDRNQNTFSNVARIEEQRLQSDYLQAQTIYNGLTQQLEAARLQLQEDSPVLKILEPPMIANKKSKPKRLFYAIGFGIVGGFIALAFILFKKERIQDKLF
jgi:uncharacterized protein involved in exopolysaccharide biosynthesis